MQYVVLLANKRDTSDRHWKTFNTLEEAEKALEAREKE